MKMRAAIFIVLGISAMLLIAFANVSNDKRVCKKVLVTISNQLNNHFVDNNDVLAMMTNGYTEIVQGTAYEDINVRELENRVKANEYVKDAEIFHDLQGNMMINVVLRRPIARIIKENGSGAYIAEDGMLMPVSDKFSSRVLLISGMTTDLQGQDYSLENEDFVKLFELVKYINKDKFWKAQIAQIDLQENKEVILLPQITKQYIEFGEIINIESKFERLNIFYKEILPRKGWNSYSRVNVKYKNQIICE